jgi:integrase
MPWRKYKPSKGKHGLIYYVSKGVQVRSDARGKWTVFVEKGGERKNKTVGEGRENLVKAIKYAEKIASQVDTIRYREADGQPKTKAPKFKKYSKDWLKNNSGRWDEYTYQRYESVLRIHLLPHETLKGKRLDEITRSDIKTRLRLLLKTKSPNTVELVHTVLCGIFQEAVDDELIPGNPARGLLKKILPPKNKRNLKEADPFDIEERDRFLAYAETKCTWPEQLILKMMVHLGMRLGEALVMRTDNLDLKKMNYRICESYKQYRFSLPKKGKKRFVDIPAFLAKELSHYIAHLRKESLKNGKRGEIDLLFPDPKEKGAWPYSQRKVQSLVRRVSKGAKLRVRNPHDLRHTYASILLMAGKNLAYVKEQLGHSSIMVTCDIYCHWIPGAGREGLEDALLGRVRQSHIIAYDQKTVSVNN